MEHPHYSASCLARAARVHESRPETVGVGNRRISDPRITTQRAASGEQLSGEPTLEYSIIMSALEQRNKKQRAAPPQRDKRHAGEDTLDDTTDDDATTPALAVELRTDGYRVAAMLQPAPLVEAKRARGAARVPERPPAFGEVRPYGTAEATALLSAIDKRVLPRALAPGLAGVVRLRIVDRRPGGGGPREVACRVGDDDEAAAAPAPPRRIGAPLPKRSLADALDDEGGYDSDDSDAASSEEIVVPEPSRRRDVVDVVEEEEEAEEASVAALRARLAVMVDVARTHGLAS